MRVYRVIEGGKVVDKSHVGLAFCLQHLDLY